MIIHTLQPNSTPVTGEPEPSGFSARFADSVNGDDANDGLTAATPFATLAAATAEELTSGTYLLLARGSRFREELTDLPTGVHVRSYGSGNRPIIDARDVAANAAFSKTVGQTNVYEIAWTHDFAPDGGKTAHRVWEEGSMMARAASLAACDAAPGSFFADAPTSGGPDTIYVHPANSLNPTTNGKEYAITKRTWAVQLYETYKQGHVTGLETIGNAYADGSLCIDGYVEDCVARDGRVHCAFILGEAVDCQALGIEAGTSGTMFVSYVAESQFGGPLNRNVLYRGCLADAGISSEIVVGYYVHTDGIRLLGTVEYRDCSAVGCSEAFSGIQAQKFVAYRCGYDDVKNAYSLYGGQGNWFLGGTGRVRSGFFTGGLVYLDSSAPDLTFIIHGCKVRALGSLNPLFVNVPLSTVLLERCTITMAGGTAWFARGDVTMRKCVEYGDLICASLGGNGNQIDAYDADYNCYWHTGISDGAFQKQYPTTAYVLTLAEWRTYLDGVALGAGTDDNSIAVDPQIPGWASLDFTINNPTVLALGAGAEVDEEDDPQLQAYWLANRVTEV